MKALGKTKEDALAELAKMAFGMMPPDAEDWETLEDFVAIMDDYGTPVLQYTVHKDFCAEIKGM